MPFDAKLCNYHLDTDGYHFKIETISEYLTRVDLYNRSMGMIVAIAVPKDGYSAGSFPIDQIETFSTHFKNKWYSFIEGIADENFIELPQTVVESGLGMDFATGEKVDMGLPSIIDSLTENTLIEHSHTHKLGDIDISNIIITGGYGALYNFNVTQGTNSLTSSDDWVVPSKAQWETLLNSIDTFDEVNQYWPLAGGKLKEAGFIHWENPNVGATDEYGFGGLGAGNRQFSFVFFKQETNFWTKTESSTNVYHTCHLAYNSSIAAIAFQASSRYMGLSIRLCNPSITTEGQTGIYVGNDGKEYPYKVIGGIAWLTKNLNETQYRNGSYISGYDDGNYTLISNESWATRGQNGEGLMCYYNDNESLGGDTNQTLADLIPTLSKQIAESEDIHPVATDSVKLYTKGVTDSFISKEGKFVKIIRGQVVGVYAPQLVFEYTSAATIPVGGNTIEFWNTQLNLPVNGTAFTDVVVVDNLVNLIGGENIHLTSPEILDVHQTSGLVSIKDYANSITSIASYCLYFNSEDYTGFINFRSIYAPMVAAVEDGAFWGLNGGSPATKMEFYFPNLSALGSTVGYNGVFAQIATNPIKLWVNNSLLTCNGGNPDGDISYLTNVEINSNSNPTIDKTPVYSDDIRIPNWDTAYNSTITSISVTGTDTKTITLNQQGGGTLTTTFTDNSGRSETPYSATSNTSYTHDVSTYINSKVSTNTAINITLSNLDEGRTGNIEITYTGAAVVTFIVDSSYTLDISSNIVGTTTNAYTVALQSKSSGHYITSYYRSGNNIYINGR